MPTSTQLSLFCVTASILILTPGPNFIYVLTRGVTQGRRPALMAALGLGCGVMVHTTLAAIGVAALIRSSYLAFQVIKYGGSGYLVYLGVKTLIDHNHALADTTHSATGSRTIIGQSIVASLSNPKTILVFLSLLPQFINTAAPNAAPQLLLLGGIYLLLTVLLYGMVGYFAGSIGRWLQRQAGVASRLHWVTGGCFIGLGAWTAVIPGSR